MIARETSAFRKKVEKRNHAAVRGLREAVNTAALRVPADGVRRFPRGLHLSPGFHVMNRDLLALDRALEASVREVFGAHDDPIEVVEARANLVLPGRDAIVWEGDAATFQFTFVGAAAERVLGYPLERWREAGFWAEQVVHPDHRSDAVAFCALATGQCRDHDFEYQACTATGDVILLHDIVVVVRGTRGVAERLRGIMIPQRASASGSAGWGKGAAVG